MASVINTNVASLNAQRNLSTSANGLNTSLQRLSSGLRINSAKDDAAGLAISERFSSQIRGQDQARRNANDGVSMAQTAEGALAKMGEIGQRVRELAVQSTNATNSASDRLAINAEVGALLSELDRFATTTDFNNTKILDGSSSSLVFQVGANANQTVTTTTANFRTTAYGTNQIGSVTATSSGVTTTSAAVTTGAAVSASGTLTIKGGAASGSVSLLTSDSAKDIASKINAQTQTGVTASARTETTVTFGATGSYTIDAFGSNTTGQTLTFNITNTGTAAGLTDVVTAFNNQTSKTGISAKLNSAGTGVVLVSDAGDNIGLIANTATSAPGTISAGGVTLAATASGSVTVAGQVMLDSDKSYTVASSSTVALTTSVLGSVLAAGASSNSSLKSVSTVDVTNFDNATQALRIVDQALTAINNQRANFGALQSRFEATIGNLQTSSENLNAARSRIRDADFAQETASLTRGQILQQAGMAMLGQANQLPNQVLSLLRG